MLINIIPEVWILLIGFLLAPIFIVGYVIILMKLTKAQTKISKSIIGVDLYIMMSLYFLWDDFLVNADWADKVTLGWKYSNFFWLLLCYAGFIVAGVFSMVLSHKNKLNKSMISSIILTIVSLFGFALSLFKVLQMFNIVV